MSKAYVDENPCPSPNQIHLRIQGDAHDIILEPGESTVENSNAGLCPLDGQLWSRAKIVSQNIAHDKFTMSLMRKVAKYDNIQAIRFDKIEWKYLCDYEVATLHQTTETLKDVKLLAKPVVSANGNIKDQDYTDLIEDKNTILIQFNDSSPTLVDVIEMKPRFSVYKDQDPKIGSELDSGDFINWWQFKNAMVPQPWYDLAADATAEDQERWNKMMEDPNNAHIFGVKQQVFMPSGHHENSHLMGKRIGRMVPIHHITLKLD